MYTHKQRLEAVLAIRKYGTLKRTIKHLGYPKDAQTLRSWLLELRPLLTTQKQDQRSKYSTAQKLTALKLLVSNGGNLKQTVAELGYPSIPALSNWVKEHGYQNMVADSRKSKSDTSHGRAYQRQPYTEKQKKTPVVEYDELPNLDRTVRVKSYTGQRYTMAQKLAAVELSLRLGSPDKAREQLGYPTSKSLMTWMRRYQAKVALQIDAENVSMGLVPFDTTETLERDGECSMTWLEPSQDMSHCSQHAVGNSVSLGDHTLTTSMESVMPQKQSSVPNKPLNSNEQSDLLSMVRQLQQEVARLKEAQAERDKELFQTRLERDILEQTIVVLKKEKGVNNNELTNAEKALIIDALRPTYKLVTLLGALKQSKTTYQRQKGIRERAKMRQDEYESIADQICEISCFNDTLVYGYRRVHAELRKRGIMHNEKIIRDIMRKYYLSPKQSRRRRYNSYRGEITPAPSNIIERDFHASKPNEKWVTDITEFSVAGTKVYLSPIIDLYDQAPIAWSIGLHPNAELVNSMLRKACQTLKPEERPILHSDRGAHYRWPVWIAITEHYGCIRSMSKKACTADNAACEGFFGILKQEWFYPGQWDGVTVEEFIAKLNEYLIWFVNHRTKTALNYMSPAEYRKVRGF